MISKMERIFADIYSFFLGEQSVFIDKLDSVKMHMPGNKDSECHLYGEYRE